METGRKLETGSSIGGVSTNPSASTLPECVRHMHLVTVQPAELILKKNNNKTKTLPAAAGT
jgi:hypothetical protein